jgi:hypothetical protein
MNRIVTRGMGTSTGLAGRSGMVTYGYGGIPKEAIKKLEDVIRRSSGNIGKKELDELKEIVVWAKLIEINNMQPKRTLLGKQAIIEKSSDNQPKNVIAQFIIAKKKRITETIKIFIKRIF